MIKAERVQLLHYFFFQTAAFGKLRCKRLLVLVHSGIELFFRYIHIVNFDVEVLSGRKAVALFFDFVVGDSHGKVFLRPPLFWKVLTILSTS